MIGECGHDALQSVGEEVRHRVMSATQIAAFPQPALVETLRCILCGSRTEVYRCLVHGGRLADPAEPCPDCAAGRPATRERRRSLGREQLEKFVRKGG